MIAAGKQAWKTRLANLRKRKRKRSRKGKGQVVGFYKDHGKTKPITKSAAQVQRKKVVAGGRKFGGVKPKAYGRRDEVQNKYVDIYRKLKAEGVNPDLGEFISQSGGLADLTKGTPSLITDVITKFLRNKDNLSAEDKGEIGKYMFAMRPLFPFGVPKLIRDIAVAYPPSLIRGMQKRGELKPFIQKAVTRPSPPVPPF
jgi:hypothetical protein